MNFILITAFAIVSGIFSTVANANTITGAGATFPAPLYQSWAREYRTQTGVIVNYQAVGSGAGLTQIQNRTVVFGGSDSPLGNDRLRSGRLFQYPSVVGAVVPIVNLPNVGDGQLRLTGELIARMYMGQITKWNDSAIIALNPNENLPNLDIKPIYRSDGSGTTFVMTTWLSRAHPTWGNQVGSATSVTWPAGVGARGNEGVAGATRNTVGSISYVEYAFANAGSTVQLMNKSGRWIVPNSTAFTRSTTAMSWPSRLVLPNIIDLIDADHPEAWPMIAATYILIPVDPRNRSEHQTAIDFFIWTMTNPVAARIATEQHYIMLPEIIRRQMIEELRSIR